MKNDLQLLELVSLEIENDSHDSHDSLTEELDHDHEETSAYSSDEASFAPIHAYHELADVPVREIDIFEAIEANIAALEDMQARMRFMVREVKYLIKA